jgi:hypothetical protein
MSAESRHSSLPKKRKSREVNGKKRCKIYIFFDLGKNRIFNHLWRVITKKSMVFSGTGSPAVITRGIPPPLGHLPPCDSHGTPFVNIQDEKGLLQTPFWQEVKGIQKPASRSKKSPFYPPTSM